MSRRESEQLLRMIEGGKLSRAICCVAEFGIADLVEAGKPRPVESLAKASKTNERALYRVLRFLASKGIFQETREQHFDHTPLSATLRSDAPDSVRPGARLFYSSFAGWGGLQHAIQSGEPGFDKIFGMPFFNYIRTDPELVAIFDASMTSLHGNEVEPILDAYSLEGIDVLADIGAGNGSFLCAALGRYPRLKGMLFDLGNASGRAWERLNAAGVADRCVIKEGSFFEGVPAGADAYHLKHIIHDWNDSQCAQILGHCRKVIPAHGKLLISEGIVPAGNEPSPAKDLDISMLNFLGGQERTEAEFRSLLSANGFRIQSIVPTTSMVSVIEARPL